MAAATSGCRSSKKKADAAPADAGADGRGEIGRGNGEAVGVGRVVPGDGLEHGGGVVGGAGQRADVLGGG